MTFGLQTNALPLSYRGITCIEKRNSHCLMQSGSVAERSKALV